MTIREEISREEFSDQIKSAFAGVKPSQELMSRLNDKNRKKRKIRYSAIKIAAAAAAVFIIGGSAVYAASEMNFIDIFGNYVHVADSELADSLMGAVHNFRYKVSDDDYAIRINGVSGDSSNMILIAEIYRKDGTPVTDYLKNFPEDETDIYMPENHYVRSFSGASSSWHSEINKDGNIQMYYEVSLSESTIKGKRFYACGSDIYSFSLLNDLREKNNVYVWYNPSEKKNEFKTYLSDEIVDISDEDIIGLRLDWNFSFIYNPSEKSESVKKCSDTDSSFELYNNIIFFSSDGKAGTESKEIWLTCKPSNIAFTSVEGEMVYSFEDIFLSDNDVSENSNYITAPVFQTDGESCNDIYIIKEDGSRIDLIFGACKDDVSGNIRTVNTSIQYIEYTGESNDEHRKYNRVFADVSEFSELYINGTVYKLE